jgi:NAD(P)-dependent dehydrogenase (short-subunit alcohol dehydrogenase family)
MDLDGQRVVVLGGTSGFGLATAAEAAGAGARVTVVSRQQSSVQKALAALPAGTDGRAVDLTNQDAVTRLFAEITVDGGIDHLVYTAGEALAVSNLDTLDLAVARQFFETRYFGALWAVHAAAPHMRPGSSITLTSGGAGRRPLPGWSVVSSICGAMESLTRALSVELAPIRVNAVSAGVIRSPLWDPLPDAAREQLYRSTAERMPVGRVGEVDDIARAFLFLMTEGFATGTILTVDGGAALV